MLKIGVLLGDVLPDTGEFVADARALEAADADSLWVAAGGTLDPWTRLGALAATTYRARLGLLGLDPALHPADALRAMLATLGRLSRGRLVLGARDAGTLARLAAVAPEGVTTVLVGESGDGAPEAWTRVPTPTDRAAWRATRAAHEKAGAAGVIVPMDPRLLDLLRNPDVDDDRSDLQIAVG